MPESKDVTRDDGTGGQREMSRHRDSRWRITKHRSVCLHIIPQTSDEACLTRVTCNSREAWTGVTKRSLQTYPFCFDALNFPKAQQNSLYSPFSSPLPHPQQSNHLEESTTFVDRMFIARRPTGSCGRKHSRFCVEAVELAQQEAPCSRKVNEAGGD